MWQIMIAYFDKVPILGWVYCRETEMELIIQRNESTYFGSPFEAIQAITKIKPSWLSKAFKITLVERNHLI
jgi:hypothetical protein